jgi:uncharacterized protein (TIRG00374 family)
MSENLSTSQSRKRDILRALPGILVSLIALALLFSLIDWQEFGEALQQADYRYLLIALPIYLLSYITRARAWQIVLLNEASLKKVFLIQQVGYMLNNLLPLRVGEFGRAYLLGRTGLGFWRVFSTILVERAFDMLFAVGLLLGTLPFVIEVQGAHQIAWVIGVVVIMGLTIFYLLARNQKKVLTGFGKLEKRWPRLVEFGRERLSSFLMGLSALAEPVHFLGAFTWMGISWFLAIFVQYFVMKAYVPDAQVLWAAFALGVAALGVALPSSPGAIGIYEGSFVAALAVVGVSHAPALAYALTTHVMYYLVTGIFGSYALVKEDESLTNLFRTIRKQGAQ